MAIRKTELRKCVRAFLAEAFLDDAPVDETAPLEDVSVEEPEVSPEPKELTVPEILASLAEMGFGDIKKISGKRFAVLIDGTGSARHAALGTIEQAFEQYGAYWDKQPTSVSSIGMINIGPISILAKPTSKQGGRSAGLDNEQILIDQINETIEQHGPINVKFFGAGAGEYSIEGVVSAEGVGADTLGRKKSDVNIVTSSGKVPVSIKKDNAVYWESADSFYGSRAAQMIDDLLASGEIELIDKDGYFNIAPNIAVPASAEETKDVVFGSDILGNGLVVKKTFTPSSFMFNAATNTLEVDATYLITDMEHVTGDYTVWFLIRNDKTRRSVPGYPGIRVLAAYEKRINPRVKRISENNARAEQLIREAVRKQLREHTGLRDLVSVICRMQVKTRGDDDPSVPDVLTMIRAAEGIVVVKQLGAIRRAKHGSEILDVEVKYMPAIKDPNIFLNELGKIIKAQHGVRMVRILTLSGHATTKTDGTNWVF